MRFVFLNLNNFSDIVWESMHPLEEFKPARISRKRRSNAKKEDAVEEKSAKVDSSCDSVTPVNGECTQVDEKRDEDQSSPSFQRNGEVFVEKDGIPPHNEPAGNEITG